MRELRFRQALYNKNGLFQAWHYWGFLGVDGVVYWASSAIGHDVSPKQALQNSQQFTGLHDKNGKEIYEGDIVSHPLCVKEPHEDNEPCETFIGRIQYEVDRGQFFAVNTKRNGYVIELTEAYKFEVIGNILEG